MQYVDGKITNDERQHILQNAIPERGNTLFCFFVFLFLFSLNNIFSVCKGGCGGMYTVNTMSTAIEAMGMSQLYWSSSLAEDPTKEKECKKDCTELIYNLLVNDNKPSDIITK